jgi:hypothetical protein
MKKPFKSTMMSAVFPEAWPKKIAIAAPLPIRTIALFARVCPDPKFIVDARGIADPLRVDRQVSGSRRAGHRQVQGDRVCRRGDSAPPNHGERPACPRR